MIEPWHEAVAVDRSVLDRKPNRLDLLGNLDHERSREERIDRIELRCHAESEMLLGRQARTARADGPEVEVRTRQPLPL